MENKATGRRMGSYIDSFQFKRHRFDLPNGRQGVRVDLDSYAVRADSLSPG